MNRTRLDVHRKQPRRRRLWRHRHRRIEELGVAVGESTGHARCSSRLWPGETGSDELAGRSLLPPLEVPVGA